MLDIASESNFKYSTLVELLKYRAIHQTERYAYKFLIDGEIEVSLTYGELQQQAQAIAAQLQRSAIIGERALLLYQPGLEFITTFLGCMYAGVIAVPAYPPRPNLSLKRLQAIVADAQATLVLTTTSILTNVKSSFSKYPELSAMHWLTTDQISISLSNAWKETAINKDTLAFIQYTSGSTGIPKGVMITHENLLYNSEYIRQAFELTPDSVSVTWLPSFHDMGLIDGIIQPLYTGFISILMSPVSFLNQPIRWLKAISHYRATHCGGPNFAYDLCVRKITHEQKKSLDLSSWCSAYNGAEPVRKSTLEMFTQTFQSCGFQISCFYPCYGLAEATLMVTGGLVKTPPIYYIGQSDILEQHQVLDISRPTNNFKHLVGCGRSWLGTKIVIVNPKSITKSAPDEVGEIWISSTSVAKGYWNKPQQTKDTFQAYLVDTGEGPFLRTGDLGFLKDGELFVTGRLKDLIVVRGRNHYPQDIELTVEKSHASLRSGCGAAFSVEIEDEERLIVVQEIDRIYLRQIDLEEVIQCIRQEVSKQHSLLIYAVLLLRTNSIPKTSSGKIQRHACRDGFLSNSLNVVKSSILKKIEVLESKELLDREVLLATSQENRQSLLESYLQKLCTIVLRVDLSQLDFQQPLSSFGIDSLMSVELQQRLESTLGLIWPMTKFLEGASITQLAMEGLTQITNCPSVPKNTFIPTDNDSKFFLSYNQKSLWFLHQIAPESGAYNISCAVRVHADIDVSFLILTLQILISRHPCLRTTYTIYDGQPIQQIGESLEVDFQKIDVSTWNSDDLNKCLIEESNRSFNLEQLPLLRVNLFTFSDRSHILLLTTHHIVCDTWSLGIILSELQVLYQAEKLNTKVTLPSLDFQYSSYVQWQDQMLMSPAGKELWNYWQYQLAGELPTLNLPTDYPRPPVQTYKGVSHTFNLSEKVIQQLKKLSLAEGATFYMTLLATFQLLLYRYTGQEDIIVGSPFAGRTRHEFKEIVGYFVNPVILRANLSGNPSFKTFLAQVRQTVLEAIEHQDYPFALIVEQLQVHRDPSRSPLFQVLFNIQQVQRFEEVVAAQQNWEGLLLEPYPINQQEGQFDLILEIVQVRETVYGVFKYNIDLFDATTISRMAGHFQILLEGIVANPNQTISELPLLTDAERHQLLVEWNNTHADYPEDKCIHQLFEEQVEKTPDAVAVVFEQQQLTYRELNNCANQLAHYLKTLGVKPKALVGICIDRSLEMLIGLLGILKAGATYVPLDPEYPNERLTYMLEDARVLVLLTQQSLKPLLPKLEIPVICLDANWKIIYHENKENLINGVQSNNLAYVIYTSGSTGKPKGVQISHQSVVNLLTFMQQELELTFQDTLLAVTTISFDIAALELYLPLIFGARVIIVSRKLIKDGVQLWQIILNSNATLMQATPSTWQLLLASGWQSQLRLKMLCGGEVLPKKLSTQLMDKGVCLWNLYGPTETTIWSTVYKVQSNQSGEQSYELSESIGHPIANTKIYILDGSLQPVPIGVPGELYICGAGLARGYRNLPVLTDEKFISNPFSDEPASRLYKTGDLARYRSDGSIEFLGRLDQQVKVRGFRIELGEIEGVLAQHPNLVQTVLAVRENNLGEKHLVAYFTTKCEQVPTASELRRFLNKKLPEYMMPSVFIPLATFPLTPNGKVDYLNLPAPSTSRPKLETDYVMPRNEVEQIIVAIWQQILQLENIGIYDNFFDLGGHSLLVVQMHSQLQANFGQELLIVDLFKYPTIYALAEYLSQHQSESDSSEQSHKRSEIRSDLEMTIQQRRQFRQRHRSTTIISHEDSIDD
jgi:amino acid adenylation domain-containing protein